MKKIQKFYLTVFMLLFIGLCGKSAAAQQTAVISNESGDRLEIAKVEPVTLPLGKRLYVKIAYQIQSTTDCRIWVRPYSYEAGPEFFYYSPSPLYKNGSGEFTGWFYFTEPTHVDRFHVNLFCDGKNILDLVTDVDATWTTAQEP
jgi:hypothetical protein